MNDSEQIPEQHIEALLRSLGLDAEADPELARTPTRFAELLRKHLVPPEQPFELSPLPESSGTGDILLRDIDFHALCAHHLVPFFGKVHIAYRPKGAIAGFGSFVRLVEHCSKGPQLQERIAESIAETIMNGLNPDGCLVIVEARQMCMELSGSSCGVTTTTLSSRGIFSEHPEQRELLAKLLIRQG